MCAVAITYPSYIYVRSDNNYIWMLGMVNYTYIFIYYTFPKKNCSVYV